VSAGLLAGAAAAQAANRAISTYLLGIPSADMTLLLADLLLLAIAAAIAVYVPAQRVTKVDPGLTLRCD